MTRSARPPLRRFLGVAFGALLLALAAEWTLRENGATSPPLGPSACRTTLPSPAIGEEAGASLVTRDYQRHPSLGWVPGPHSSHRPQTERIPRDDAPWVAVFGDGSVTHDPSRPGGSLPGKLGDALQVPVLSYAVAGHSLARIVERTTETLEALEHPPRTVVVGFRADIVEQLSPSVHPSSSEPFRSRLLETLTSLSARTPASTATVDCEQYVERSLIVTLLQELQAVTEGTSELIIAILPPAVPGPEHHGNRALLTGVLSELAIHSALLWDPESNVNARGQVAHAAAAMADRLAHPTDYYWGLPIDFGQDGNAESYQPAGFRRPDKRSRWTTQPTAHLRVSPPPTAGGILVDVDFTNAIATEGDTRELVVRVGGVAVGRWPMARLRKHLRDTFFLDAGLATARPLEFQFELEPLYSPRDIGLNQDPTPLGVAISSLTLRPDTTNVGEVAASH